MKEKGEEGAGGGGEEKRNFILQDIIPEFAWWDRRKQILSK
jgi:hypothetical protein